MAHRCKISKVSRQAGHRVSHANNKTKHTFRANIQTRRIVDPATGNKIRVKLSTRMMRTIDKIGLQEALRKNKMTFKDLR